ncbi:MAG TPA: sigma 54-interacting transcriptional regulator [Polyangiaceae bacterium]|nr:sigma 54-interacting transcriptional regulator [Polyangiaceae bacterium]
MEQPTTEQVTSPRASKLEGRAYALLVVSDGETSMYPLPHDGRLLIGRSKHADIRIDHGSVSREHAALHLGDSLLLEDLGSANGTRLRGGKLLPGLAVQAAPDDVIDLGQVMLVIKHRTLEQRLRPTCSAELFDLRLEEECERAASGAARFAVVSLVVTGGLPVQGIEALLAGELRQRDLLATRAPGHYELLMLDAGPEEAQERSGRAAAALCERQLRVDTRLFCSPRDGVSPTRLLGRGPDSLPPSSPNPMAEFIVVDDAMRRVRRLLERVGRSELSVVLLGETGVGKEMCAELLHLSSTRAGRTFLRLNCAALSESLLESELFGHERGAFTGATADKQGLLEAANGGSLFLDEVGDMPLSTQVKLLRVLESKEILPLGSRAPRRIDVRIIAATNRDLEEHITQGSFREDLYYRLNGISIMVPPLRERPADIEPLARFFVTRRTDTLKPPQIAPRLSEASLNWLRCQPWPGNVRELRNVVERALVLCEGALIEPVHLSQSPRKSARPLLESAATLSERGLRHEVKSLERERIEEALRASGGNQRRAAELLGLSRGALLRRLEQLGIARPRKGV